MTIKSWVQGKIRRFTWFDIFLIKLSVASFMLLVAKLWPEVLALDWQIYALVFLVSYFFSFYRFFRSEL